MYVISGQRMKEEITVLNNFKNHTSKTNLRKNKRLQKASDIQTLHYEKPKKIRMFVINNSRRLLISSCKNSD